MFMDDNGLFIISVSCTFLICCFEESSPQNENVIIYSPSCHSIFFFLLNTKEDIFKNIGNSWLWLLTSIDMRT